MSERKKNIGTVLLSFGGLIILLEIFGLVTGVFVGPEFLYFVGGALEGVGMVFFLSSFLIREDYVKNMEMI
ncbi:MAG: hypothetical protein RTS72_07950 [Candidatus Thorarchaeota archaeon]